MTFFGKDHSKLIKYQYDLLKLQIQNDNVDVHFHLLDAEDPYYQENPGELTTRIGAAKELYKLYDELAAGDRHRLHLWQYSGRPTFTYTQLDETIIFGPYLPKVDNADTPEFEIVPDNDTWMYEVCKAAFKAAITDAPLVRPTQPSAAGDTV